MPSGTRQVNREWWGWCRMSKASRTQCSFSLIVLMVKTDQNHTNWIWPMGLPLCDSLAPSPATSNWPLNSWRVHLEGALKSAPGFLSPFALLKSLPPVWQPLPTSTGAVLYPHSAVQQLLSHHSLHTAHTVLSTYNILPTSYFCSSWVSFVLESTVPNTRYTFHRCLLNIWINENAKEMASAITWPQWCVSFLYIKHIKIDVNITSKFLTPQSISK